MPAKLPTVLITEALPFIKEEIEILKKYARVKVAKSSKEEKLIKETENVDVIMVAYAKITKKIIDAGKNLKGISRYGTGVDNIDLKAASKKNILVTNVPTYATNAVADHTFALLLSLARKINRIDKTFRSGSWKSWTSPPTIYMGESLKGKNLGIMGFGNIGQAVAKRARSFGMNVLVFDPYFDKSVIEKCGCMAVERDELLSESDFISLHLPLTPETRGTIGKKELEKMKRTAYLINTSRGPIIDERALINALRRGQIAGAALDVFEKEPPSRDNQLLKFENVILTPHVAWFNEEAVRELELSAVNNTIDILQGKTPNNIVK